MASGVVTLGFLLALISVISGFAFHKKSNLINSHKKMLLHNSIASKHVSVSKRVLALEQLKKSVQEKAMKELMKKSNCDSILDCVNTVSEVLIGLDPSSPDICGIALSAIGDAYECLDGYKQCGSNYDQYKAMLDMMADSIEPVCGGQGVSCDMFAVEAAYTECIEEMDEDFSHIETPKELCDILPTVKQSIFACFGEVQVDHPACTMFHETYQSMAAEIFTPSEKECAEEGGLAMNECDTDAFDADYEECLAVLEDMDESDDCKEAWDALEGSVDCMNKIGENDSKWIEDCEVIRAVIIGSLKPAKDALEQYCPI